MSEQEAQFERKLRPWSGRAILTTFACVIAAMVFEDLGWLPYIGGFSLASAFALVIEYWIPPKPPVSFPIWVLKILAFFIPILLGLWIIPKVLSRWIWAPLAYGLPTFILFISIYWMPPLYPIKRSDALWKWLLFSFGFALVFAWIGHYTPYK
jgi:hypothetical protein